MFALLTGLSLLYGSLAGCDNSTPAASGQGDGSEQTDGGAEAEGIQALRYTHDVLGFSIAYPESWDVKQNFETFAFMGISPQENDEDLYGENVSVVAMSTPPDMSLEDFSALQIRGAKEGLKDYARRGASFEEINGVRAARFDYVYTVKDLRIVSITFIIVKDNIAYAINCKATLDDYDRYRAMMLQIARSFRFVN